MSTRRSSRRSAASVSSSKSRTSIRPSIRRGLESLAEGNASYIAKLLSLVVDDETTTNKIADGLEQCMGMNNLTAEMLLARFFDKSILSQYSQRVLSKSGKGSVATLAARITKEWSKPDFLSSSAKRKRGGDDVGDTSGEHGETSKKTNTKQGKDQIDSSNDDDDDDDWKRPLFYWKGQLDYDPDKDTLHWNGSWVSGLAEDGLPEEKEFEESKQSALFKLYNSGKLIKDPKAEIEQTDDNGPLQYIVGLSGRFKGSYLLDQGDSQGPNTFTDVAHHFDFHSCSSRNTKKGEGDETEDVVLATATGTTEFGGFVSAGYVRVRRDIPEVAELVLARRYIDKKDSRASWMNKTQRNILIDKFLKETASFGIHSKSFWVDSLPRKA